MTDGHEFTMDGERYRKALRKSRKERFDKWRKEIDKDNDEANNRRNKKPDSE